MRNFIECVSVTVFAFLCGVLTGVVGMFHTENNLFLDILCINVSILSFLWAAANLEINEQEGDRA